MGLFGRKRDRERARDEDDRERDLEGAFEGDLELDGDLDRGYHDGAYRDDRDGDLDDDLDDLDRDIDELGWDDGPYDEEDAPDDDVVRLDLGSVRLPVPDGAQLQVEMDPAGPVRAVHVITPAGQLTVNGYAAPRSGGLWREVCGELAEQLRADGARVHSTVGDWGQELVASLGEVALRFVGVDGPRWMLRGVVAGPPEHAEHGAAALRDLVRGTVVVRGSLPMPVRTPLPIELPPAIAEHVAAQAAQGGAQQPGTMG